MIRKTKEKNKVNMGTHPQEEKKKVFLQPDYLKAISVPSIIGIFFFFLFSDSGTLGIFAGGEEG